MTRPGQTAPGRDRAGPPRSLLARIDRGRMTSLALACGLLALLVFRHEYFGIQHDAEIYTLMALRILDPTALAGDAFFAFGSQGDFTVFPWLHAGLLRGLSLEQAAWLLTRAGQLAWALAALRLARQVLGAPLHWAGVALLLALPGNYGAHGVFAYCENFATPRIWAEAGVLLAAGYALSGRWRAAVLATAGALALHPIMALPGALLLVLVPDPRRVAPRLAIAGLVALAAATACAWLHPWGPLRLVDPEWMVGVRMFADYLLANDWQLGDWQRFAVPEATLVLAALAMRPSVQRNLALSALLLGAAGVALALATTHGLPLAILLQGQPWRWAWLTKVVAILLLPALGGELWRRTPNGRGLAVLLAAAWLGSEDALGLEAALAMVVLAVLSLRTTRPLAQLGPLAALLGAGVIVGVYAITGATHWMIAVVASVALWAVLFRLALPGVAVAGIALALSVVLGQQVARAIRLPLANDYDTLAHDLAPWRALIAPDQSVLFTTNLHAAWLGLERRSFLVMAGVIFSRESTMAARRRVAEIEAPGHPRVALGEVEVRATSALPLGEVQRLCRIPGLDFIVSPFEYPVRHPSVATSTPFPWLHLYDCRLVAQAAADGA